MGHVAHHQAHQVAAAQLAVDRQVEQGDLAGLAGHLQLGANRPDLPGASGVASARSVCLCSKACGRVPLVIGVVHGLFPPWLARKQKLGLTPAIAHRPKPADDNPAFSSAVSNKADLVGVRQRFLHFWATRSRPHALRGLEVLPQRKSGLLKAIIVIAFRDPHDGTWRGLCHETQLALPVWYPDFVDECSGTRNGLRSA